MNILFIMYDQLRFDYLSCAGHPHLHTPNFDRVAAMGVRFSNAYAQSPICGASRMCFYTGRYASSHGAQWNGFPLRVGELTMGDHLRAIGMDCWLVGKTHMRPDTEGMARLGISPESVIGARQAECGFDVFVRDDGLWGEGPDGFYDERHSPYNEFLRSKGYEGENPWAHYANAGIDDDGAIATGWILGNADRAANIREEDSETPWLTGEAIRFIESAETPWCAHISYIKPHWPYIVPEPYHAMYGPNHVPQAIRSEVEREDPHPVFGAYMENAIARAFRRDEVRGKVIPAYMGLIKQCDDQLGRLLDFLEATGRLDDTMIVLTSDHGDYLGDHWLGEKDLFHDPSVKIPLIVYDPRPEADESRGTVSDALVESIDVAATFVEAAGGKVYPITLSRAAHCSRGFAARHRNGGVSWLVNSTTRQLRNAPGSASGRETRACSWCLTDVLNSFTPRVGSGRCCSTFGPIPTSSRIWRKRAPTKTISTAFMIFSRNGDGDWRRGSRNRKPTSKRCADGPFGAESFRFSRMEARCGMNSWRNT